MLRESLAAAERERDGTATGKQSVACGAGESKAMKQALELLAQALSGPQVKKFRVSSHSLAA